MFVLVVVLLFILFNFWSDFQGGAEGESPVADRVLVRLYTPLLRGVHFISSKISDVFKHYFMLVGISLENERLKEDLVFKDYYILSLEEKLGVKNFENITQQKLGELGFEGIFSRVIGYDAQASVQTVLVSRGSLDGVTLNAPVITFEGLVGRVVKVFDHSSRVLLVVDPRFSVDVINQKTRVRAIVTGVGQKAMAKRYPLLSHTEFLEAGFKTMNEGDPLITAGMTGNYPPGIPVGRVIQMRHTTDGLFESSAVLPAVDFSKLEEVAILTENKEP